MDKNQLKNVSIIFFDIDDTFSSESRIRPEAFQALWDLHRAGFKLVPVTGRPAGWCDHIARMWPVDAVVGENGAFYLYQGKHKLVKTYLLPDTTRAQNKKKLQNLYKTLLKDFPKLKLASDQGYREFDLAVDYCEDVPTWPDAQVQKLLTTALKRGAHAKLSNIHVNIWYGNYDKLTCVKRVLSDFFSVPFEKNSNKIIYIGDSPNDEPFFESFKLSVGVANIKKYLEKGYLKHAPRFITKNEAGLGFAETAQVLLKIK